QFCAAATSPRLREKASASVMTHRPAFSRLPICVRVVSATVVITLYGLCIPTYAQPPWSWQDNPAIPPEPANHVSFVRDYSGKYSLVDWQMKKDILDVVGPKFGRIDIVMQQCFGGGFVGDVAAATGVPRTIVSSSAWNETSWNVIQADNTPLALWNFT